MKRLAILLSLMASPALAATGPFFSLYNTDFVVLIAFLIFVGVLVALGVPGKVVAMLDKRADQIRGELDEAKALREEAQTVLASYERKQREVKEQTEAIIAHARSEAEDAAESAKKDIADSIARRLQAAEEQIASAEAGALRQVRDRAIAVATAAAADVLSGQMTDAKGNALIDDAIKQVGAKLH
ncbi:F-type H+-transporting ATPase subunit b [Rhodovulum iodosum]|uniref:ATP synthase subunit b n=1 Tax=Rhodovulum iodosum TaxID=68291 RepID=A0ABV3XQ53_9RHOB|nr:F0F1 ATP synthase subunit B [Rhodovulum robiginosum]RSK31276.1 F0F1 ATP synthase subunit B [Rhodovulum robiginosum]